MKFLDDIINECDIALKTLSNKKSGTGRTYPPEPSEKNTEKLTPEEKKTFYPNDAGKSCWRSSSSGPLQRTVTCM
jgi:hypothetical protein